ncbi:hypothetical protein PI124_g14461 [Phytophthora idaei]|nr:hypothetical protein PI125_g20452 [Phytophthora idaei]KAG3131956.1 hypothetical protein PI126_g19841 [Phytophthora idaei]KAG3240639.1 hypothetical protein PI124_g14461 [Phytophthora idaei]
MPATTSRLTRGPNWGPQEDKQLAKAWVLVSTDAEVGTYQKADIFREKVESHYNSIRPRTHKKFERGPNSVMKRWKALRVAVVIFCGCYASVLQLNESGKSAEDHLDDAKVMYEKLYEQRFEFLGAWRELHDEPKWKELRNSSNVRADRRKRSVSGGGGGGDEPDRGAMAERAAGDMVDVAAAERSRPAGAKKAKAGRSMEASSHKIADAATSMSKTSEMKVSIATEKLQLLKEREENRILFQPTEGLDQISLRILELKKQSILRRLEEEASTSTSEASENTNLNSSENGEDALIQ